MSTESALWGTFSVADHLRKHAFVSDVLLYDRLVVPVPESASEHERWQGLGRDPDLQQELLGIVGELAVPVPWSVERHRQWVARYAAIAAPAEEPAVRDDLAQAVAFDVRNVAQARRDATGPQAPGVDPDDPGYLMTRMVLADEFGSVKDRALVARIPRIDEIEAVVAYGSYDAFARERGALTNEPAAGTQPVFTFGWSFLVPDNSQRSDDDLLRAAVELAHADEVSDWRAAVQRWRRDSLLRGQSDAEALRNMGLSSPFGGEKHGNRPRSRCYSAASAFSRADRKLPTFPSVPIPPAIHGRRATTSRRHPAPPQAQGGRRSLPLAGTSCSGARNASQASRSDRPQPSWSGGS
jgi:hypothetical protein